MMSSTTAKMQSQLHQKSSTRLLRTLHSYTLIHEATHHNHQMYLIRWHQLQGACSMQLQCMMATSTQLSSCQHSIAVTAEVAIQLLKCCMCCLLMTFLQITQNDCWHLQNCNQRLVVLYLTNNKQKLRCHQASYHSNELTLTTSLMTAI